MLYKFKSKATADLIMLQANGQKLLHIIGKNHEANTPPKGILLPEQMPAAIAALEDAVAEEDAAIQAAQSQARSLGEDPPRVEGILLRQRAAPFLAMLRRCEKAGKEIVWGV